MSELIVVGILTSILSGYVGDTANVTIMLYTPVEQHIFIEQTEYFIQANRTNQIVVPVEITKGAVEKIISVRASNMQYDLPVTIVGRTNWSWLWWLLLIPAVTLVAAFSVRKVFGSS
jgi:hypothetical protein